jgi:nucleoside-diphosphate-sugar epimerase
VLRLFSVYGERERPEKLYHKLIRSILAHEEFPLHEGSELHVRSYTHVADAVDAALLALKHKDKVVGEIFNIGSDSTITTGEGIRIIETLIGEKAKIISTPKRRGDQLETSAHIEKARRILGYAPSISPKEGLARQVAWYKNKVLDKVK